MIDVTNPADILAALIRCPSVTPAEGGALVLLQELLEGLGFMVERPVFREDGTADVENLYARLGDSGRNLMFAGHTDVVPAGDIASWTHPPFGAVVENGFLYGRGAVDMKGGIACFLAAVARHLNDRGAVGGAISFLITGDEEGPSINGTEKLLAWAFEGGERWDAAIVGEPTNPDLLGDMIKNGRRGSLSGTVIVHGRQGHAAYPHLADNTVRSIVALAVALMVPPLDAGTAEFQPSNLEITSIDTGNQAVNVIPARATAQFNIRFNDLWTAKTLMAEIEERLQRAANARTVPSGTADPVQFELVWRDRPSEAFLTRDEALTATLAAAIADVTGRTPVLSTTGGTSDARFIKDYCPVVEFGLVGQTMHMVDERVSLADLETLTQIYGRFLSEWFRA